MVWASEFDKVDRIRRLVFHIAHLARDGVPLKRSFGPGRVQQFERCLYGGIG
nr:hypothetical protein [Alcaligenes faecalis]